MPTLSKASLVWEVDRASSTVLNLLSAKVGLERVTASTRVSRHPHPRGGLLVQCDGQDGAFAFSVVTEDDERHVIEPSPRAAAVTEDWSATNRL